MSPMVFNNVHDFVVWNSGDTKTAIFPIVSHCRELIYQVQMSNGDVGLCAEGMTYNGKSHPRFSIKYMTSKQETAAYQYHSKWKRKRNSKGKVCGQKCKIHFVEYCGKVNFVFGLESNLAYNLPTHLFSCHVRPLDQQQEQLN